MTLGRNIRDTSSTSSAGEVDMSFEQLLALFDLERGFTQEDLDQSYRDLVQVWHPDKYAHNARLQQKAEEKLKDINRAYALLKEFLSRSPLSADRNATLAGSMPIRTHHGPHDRKMPEAADGGVRPHTQASHTRGSPRIPLTSVFHPTDFSAASEVAFNHALKIAVMAKAPLRVLHVTPSREEIDFAEFPEVRQTLERWGILPADSSQADVFTQTGVFVEKVASVHAHPVFAIQEFLRHRPSDLMVLATHQWQEPLRWVKPVVAEPLARAADALTLFIPQGGDGFISPHDGTVQVQHILIPVDHHPPAQRALDAALTLARLLGCPQARLTLLHVGDPHDRPVVHAPTHEGWTWEHVSRHGEVVAEILTVASEHAVDLVVMATQGHDGWLDALRGSTTERVLRRVRCPLLAIPTVGQTV
jgi:nucleotide-binding universal stress UspA family protein